MILEKKFYAEEKNLNLTWKVLNKALCHGRSISFTWRHCWWNILYTKLIGISFFKINGDPFVHVI